MSVAGPKAPVLPTLAAVPSCFCFCEASFFRGAKGLRTVPLHCSVIGSTDGLSFSLWEPRMVLAGGWANRIIRPLAYTDKARRLLWGSAFPRRTVRGGLLRVRACLFSLSDCGRWKKHAPVSARRIRIAPFVRCRLLCGAPGVEEEWLRSPGFVGDDIEIECPATPVGAGRYPSLLFPLVSCSLDWPPIAYALSLIPAVRPSVGPGEWT